MLLNKAVLLTAAHLIILSLTFSGASVEGSRNASILVFGRSGSDISSTVRMLLGSFAPPKETESATLSANGSVITEYVVPIPGDSPSFLKIVDIEGVADDRLPEEDAYIQASLKTYLTHPEGLNSEPPTAVLIVSRFDDALSQFNGSQSLYIKTLKRITDVEKSVYQNEIPDINILLFSHFMAEVKSVKRSPRNKLESFKSAAIQFVEGISKNIVALVGENRGEDYGLTLNKDGTYKLPNRQFYPTNVFEALANLTEGKGDSSNTSIFEIFTTLRFNSSGDGRIKASRVPFNIAPDTKDVDYFIRTIVRSGMGDIDDNEVNSALQRTYEAFSDNNLKSRTATTVPRLQTFFQSKNMTKISDLPSTGLDKVKLFQSLPIGIQQDVVHLLQEALNITMPPFSQSLTVGHGYEFLKDEILPSDSVPFTPKAMSTWKFSGLGYLLPSFLSCDKLPSTQIHRYMYFANAVDQSIVQRQAYLDYPNKEAFNIANFAGQLRLGFNIKPRNDDVPALSAVKEIQTHKMQLNDKTELSDEFKDSVRHLTPFDSSDRESEKEWKSFFERWGTHVVSSGFVGGFIQGTVISDDITAAYENETQLVNALEQIVNFTQVDMDGVSFYGVFGGEKDPKLANVHELPAEERKEIVDKWEFSLTYEPVVLNYQMGLIPISALIGRVNETMGAPAAAALDLFLQGNLTYRRVRQKPYTGPPTTKKPRPVTSTPTKTSPPPPFFSPTPTISPAAGNISGDPVMGLSEKEAEIARRVLIWSASNPHNSISLDVYIKESAIQRERERIAHEETMRRHREKLEQERQKRQQTLDDYRKKADEERQKDRDNAAKIHELQMEALELQRTKELMELEKQVNEQAKLLMEENARKEKEAAKRKLKNRTWLQGVLSAGTDVRRQ